MEGKDGEEKCIQQKLPGHKALLELCSEQLLQEPKENLVCTFLCIGVGTL